MPLRYPCFISYRHGQYDLLRRIIGDFYEALAGELEAQTGYTPYLDRERLKGGSFYNEALATALCESLCMVVVFTPPYFDATHSYCAREFRAMELLEERRLKLLPQAQRENGLIISIIFRGKDQIPDIIKSRRQYYPDFEDFLLSDRKMSRHRNYAQKIHEIAEYIAARWYEFQAVGEAACGDCTTFALPKAQDIVSWLATVKRPMVAFPR